MHRSSISIFLTAVFLAMTGCGAPPPPEEEIVNPRDVYDEALDGHEQIAEAMAQAKAEQKRVLITWGGDWCLHCRNLDQLISEDDAIQGILDEYYVKVKIDVGRREKHMALAKEYGADLDEVSIPHMSILNTEGTVIAEIVQDNYVDEDADVLEQHHPEIIAGKLKMWTPHLSN